MSHDEVKNPFPGLRPFEFGDNHLFFGRDQQTTELTTRLRKNRFVAVVGTSGSGKSSLVRAGLMPELLSGTMAGAGSSWETTIMRPGGDPLTNLANAIVEADLYDPDEEDIASQVRATLTRSGLGLVEAIRQSELPTGTNFLLVVDQFEEIFRFRRSDDATDEQAAFFVNLLLEASAQADLPLYVIITMRSDFLGECSQFPRLADTVNEGEFLIPRLNRDQRKEAIVGPVKVAGGEITDRLLLRLLNDIGDDPDQLPILQHALMRTWDLFEKRGGDGALDLEHYQATGGMGEALSRHADEVYGELQDDEHKRIAEKLFKSLTEKVDANRGIRRPMQLAELHEICGGEESHLRDVLNDFRKTGCTFLMPAGEVEIKTKTIIDISHESLMRAWRSLRNWVDEEAQSAKIYRRLADTATLYHEAKAGLYRDPDLQISLSWREENRPNKTWADRYYPGFDSAMAFLDQSQEEANREEREREEARQRELEQAKSLAEEQKRRALDQARTAKIFKIAGACLFALLCVSLYLMNVAIESKKEVSEKIFQLAARSTATAERAITENKLYESLAWLNDASVLSKGDAVAQTYVATKIKTLLPNIPFLEKVEMLSQPMVDYKLGTKKINLFSRSGNGYGRLDEFDLLNRTLSETEFKSFRSTWGKFNTNGDFLCYSTIDDKLRIIDKINNNDSPITGYSGFLRMSTFSPNNDKIAVISETDTTVLSILNFNGLNEIKPFQFGHILRNTHLEYVSDHSIIVGGNYIKSGEEFFSIVFFKLANNELQKKRELTQLGSITAHSFSQGGSSYSVGLSGAKAKGNEVQVNTYDAETGVLSNSNDEYNYIIKIMNYDLTGSRLAVVDERDNVLVLDLPRNTVQRVNEQLSNITSAKFSPLGSHLIVISSINGVNFYETGSLRKSFPRFNLGGNIHFAAMNHDEEMLLVSASQGFDSALFIFKFVDSKETIVSAEMSSEWDMPYAGNMPADLWHGPKEYAYDGDVSTIVHNSMQDDDPHWVGELEGNRRINAIEIINRPRLQFRSQMANYLVTLLDENKNIVWSKKYLDSSDVSYEPVEKLLCKIDEEIYARYIKIQCYAANNWRGKVISFAEINVYGENGFYNLTNNELLEVAKYINIYKLNNEGELEVRSLIDLNDNLIALSEKPYIKNIIGQNVSSSDIIYDSLMTRYKEKNWPSFIGAYDRLQTSYNYPMTNYVDVFYANALLEQRQYSRAYDIYIENIDRLRKNEQANLLILSSQQGTDDDINDIDINSVVAEYPEVSLFVGSDNPTTVNEGISYINSKLPSYYAANVVFGAQFYESFLIEFEISNDSSGEILSMGGKNYTDGFSVWKEGNLLHIVVTNKDIRESRRININLWRFSGPDEGYWGKHHVLWNNKDLKINYLIDGNKVAEADFKGPLGNKHPPLTIGGDPINHKYGNLKLASLTVWDKALNEEQISDASALGEPVYQLTPENIEASGESFNVTIGKEESTVDAYGHVSNDDKTYLEVTNNADDSGLLINYLIKSALEFLNENYQESAKYLKYAFELNQPGGEDHLQYYIASLLLKKINDSELKAHVENQQIGKSTNWKLKFILDKLIRTTHK